MQIPWLQMAKREDKSEFEWGRLKDILIGILPLWKVERSQ